MNYYKAVRPDGTDFQTGTIDYAAALDTGEVIRHPSKRKTRNDASTYLSVSVAPANCTGFSWPCRLFRVEPVGRVMANLSASPNKRAVSALRVVEELPAHQALGPNGEKVAAFIERCRALTAVQAKALYAAWSAAWSATRYAPLHAAWSATRYAPLHAAWSATRDATRRYAAWSATRYATRYAAGSAAGDAASAILVRDLITTEQYATLVQPFVDAGLGEWVA